MLVLSFVELFVGLIEFFDGFVEAFHGLKTLVAWWDASLLYEPKGP